MLAAELHCYLFYWEYGWASCERSESNVRTHLSGYAYCVASGPVTYLYAAPALGESDVYPLRRNVDHATQATVSEQNTLLASTDKHMPPPRICTN